MMMPKRRLSKDPESMSNAEAKPAPTKDPTVDPKLFIDMKRANKVPSIPGGHSCPDKIRKGINLQFFFPIENSGKELELRDVTITTTKGSNVPFQQQNLRRK